MYSPNPSFGKCAGTQSIITPMPPWWHLSTNVIKILGGAVAAGGRKVAGDLVAPAAVEGVSVMGSSSRWV